MFHGFPGERRMRTDAVVAHREDPLLAVPFAGNVNPRRSLAEGCLLLPVLSQPGVGQQIGDLPTGTPILLSP